jgi:hypothetical protein
LSFQREEEAKEIGKALEIITDSIAPGFSKETRMPSEDECKFVGVIRIKFKHVSSKVREGAPSPDSEHPDNPHWAGLVPIRQNFGPPIRASYIRKDTPVPDCVVRLVGGRGANSIVTDPPPIHGTTDTRPPGAPHF